MNSLSSNLWADADPRRAALALATLDASLIHIAVLDENGVIVLTNQAWKAFFAQEGLAQAKAIEGANYLDVCNRAPDELSAAAHRAADGIRDLLQGRQSQFAIEYPRFMLDEERWFLCSGRRYSAAGLTHIVLSHQDITHIKQAETERRDLQNQLAHACRVATMGEMVASIAHELNQPLAAIEFYAEGCTDRLRSQSWTANELLQQFEKIGELASSCSQIIRRLRGFAVKRQPVPVRIDLRELVESVVAILGHKARLAEVPCFIEHPEEPLWALVDPVQIQQVLLNLLRNAIEAQSDTPSDTRRINIILRRAGNGCLEIAVQDRGAGVAPADLKYLFQPFFTTKPSGLGMGLKISQTIVQSYRGDIACHINPDGGMTFIVSLPTIDATNEDQS